MAVDFIHRSYHLIISPLSQCPVWVRTPRGANLYQAKFYLRVFQVFFLEVFQFSPPHQLVGSSRIASDTIITGYFGSKAQEWKKKDRKRIGKIRRIYFSGKS